MIEMKSEYLTTALNILHEKKKVPLKLENIYKFKLKEFCALTMQISANAFLFVGGGKFIEESQKNLELFTASVINLNSIFKTQFQFKENVLGFRFDLEDQVILTLYIQKTDISFGDIDQYLILLKEFVCLDHEYKLSIADARLKLADMSLAEVHFAGVHLDAERFVNILCLQRTTKNRQWFCVNCSENVYRFKNFDFTYALLFRFLKESANYTEFQEEFSQKFPDILNVTYLPAEYIDQAFEMEFATSISISQELVVQNPLLTNTL